MLGGKEAQELAIEDLFDHRCSIYHLQTTTTDPGFGLPGQTTHSYPDTPDLENVPCHFNVGASAQLPAGTDVRANDKIVNEENGLDFTAQVPQNIRGHHMTVTIQRKGNIEAAL